MEQIHKNILKLFEAPEKPDLSELDLMDSVNKDPGTLEEIEAFAKVALNDGDLENAIRLYREALQKRSDSDSVGYINLAGVLAAADETSEAIECYQQAYQIDSNPEALIGISDLQNREGNFQEALEALEKAIELEPSNAGYHFQLSEMLLDHNYPKKALSAAELAARMAPANSFYHEFAGQINFTLQQHNQALAAFQQAVELSPGDAELYIWVASCFWRLEKENQALKALQLASDLDPSDLVYMTLHERCRLALGDLQSEDLTEMKSEPLRGYEKDRLFRFLELFNLSK